jgi:hypothetical protein
MTSTRRLAVRVKAAAGVALETCVGVPVEDLVMYEVTRDAHESAASIASALTATRAREAGKRL